MLAIHEEDQDMHTFTTYDEAKAYLEGGRAKNHRAVSANTRLWARENGDLVLVLHQTPIVTYHEDGTVTIWSGDWDTPTTRNRINQFAPIRVWSDGQGGWAIGWTKERTPSKVQKCRTCHGTGQLPWGPYCYRCGGTGRAEYGNQPIPLTVSPHVPFKVTSEGEYIGPVSPWPVAPGNGYSQRHTAWMH